MKRTFLIAAFVVIQLFYAASVQAFESSPIGWATLSDGNVPYTITGGSAGATVIVTDEPNFKAYATSSLPYVIIVPTTITMTRGAEVVSVRSNKTIIGIGSNPGINGGLNISNRSNIIIRNLSVWYEDAAQGCSDPWTDGIRTQSGANHIWIDHCSFFDSPDGLLDPTDRSNYITISWCKFYYTPGSENTCHRFTNLVGSTDDGNDGDPGKLKETFHHNWWGSGCKERMPRVRFGQVHVFNNYYSDLMSGGYCHGVGVECQIRVENNYYNTVPNPWKNYSQAGIQGKIGWNTGNVFHNCPVPTWAPNDYNDPNKIFVPPYSYTLDAGADVNTIVMNGAGVDRLTPSPNPMTFSVAPYAVDGCSIAMTAATATCNDGVDYNFTCTAGGGHSTGWQTSPSYTDIGLLPGLTYTYTVQARNQTQTIFTGAASNPASATTIPVNDFNAPIPNPMTWAVVPHGTDFHSISMTATTATDSSGVEYSFTCTAGSGHSSSWQDNTIYTDTGLAEGSTCTYTVTARDKSPNHNETAASDPCTGMTLVDANAPTPNPMTFDVAPHATDINSIAMVAATATDISGVEYYFANITDPNHNSGWQDDTNYTDTALINGKTYSYRVKARDLSLNQNETAWSSEANATTLRYSCSDAIISDLDENCRVDCLDYTLLAGHWDDALPLNNDIAVNGTFNTDIVPGWQAFDLPSAVGEFLFMYDGDYGNPVGSAVMGGDTGATGISGHYFYQVIPVRAGKQYKLSAEWMGDLSGYVSSDPCHLSNWAQVLVSFETSPDANTWTVWIDPNAVMYAKVFGVADKNIDSSGTWPTWEPITASQTNGPADGIFTASGNYMVVAFSEGGLPEFRHGLFLCRQREDRRP